MFSTNQLSEKEAEELIQYIKTLKRGFDKDEFNLRIENLAQFVDSCGLTNDNFHKLLKIWLSLTIPVTKWMGIGVCLVPRERMEARSVDYVLRWLLANYQNQTSFTRIGFVLDWLTAAMESDSIDMEELDKGYEVFYMLLCYEILTKHAIKLVYTLSKPTDVTRQRVNELIDIAKKRDAQKSKCRQIQVLLGLFKSYKPEFVPESIPAFSIHTAFKKVNEKLVERFNRCQKRRTSSEEKQRLLWTNPLNAKGNKKADPLVPNMEIPFKDLDNHGKQTGGKNVFDFTEPASLLGYKLRHELRRPAKLRALLCNEAGVTLLIAAPDDTHAFFSHDLHHILGDCFLHTSPYSYAEKQDFLIRLARLQRTLLQGIPVITRFLALYLPLWNEKDFFHEILSLVEWISVDSPIHVPYILRPLGRAFHRARPLQQCAILTALVNLYENLAYASVRPKHHFMSMGPSNNYGPLLASLVLFIGEICNKALQVSPDDMRALYWSLWSTERVARTQRRHGLSLQLPPTLAFSLPLLSTSAALIDKMAATMMLYKSIVKKMKKSSTATSRLLEDHLWTLQAYTVDMISCLWNEQLLSERRTGIVFSRLPVHLVEKLSKSVPNVDGALSLRSHVALAPYTYTQVEGVNYKDTNNKMWFDTVIEPEFVSIGKFLKIIASCADDA